MFNIVLHEPQIPQNTGNIARTCAAIGCKLHIIEPIGFSIDESAVKRAGLDYWDKVFVSTYKNLDEFLKHTNTPVIPVSTKAQKRYDAIKYPKGSNFLFGKETAGLPNYILQEYTQNAVRVPMKENLRSLNLSNTVAIIAYEAFRQYGFPGLV